MDSARIRNASFEIIVEGRKTRVDVEVPDGPVEPQRMLPLLRSLTDGFVRLATDAVEAEGSSISCHKGCGACCRQLVPISQLEAESIRRLVDAMPDARRAQVVGAFAHACERLSQAGLLDVLRSPEHWKPQDVHPIGRRYFSEGIPCPFLEDEACSIHAERPLACREYLVTSPAVNCANPTAETICCVPMPIKVSRGLRAIDPDRPVKAAWVPLILALAVSDAEWTRRQSGPSMFAAVLKRITHTDIPDPPLDDPTTDLPSTARG
jgi:Fe-S-cluster containining protein